MKTNLKVLHLVIKLSLLPLVLYFHEEDQDVILSHYSSEDPKNCSDVHRFGFFVEISAFCGMVTRMQRSDALKTRNIPIIVSSLDQVNHSVV
jgi:hypothetical protein